MGKKGSVGVVCTIKADMAHAWRTNIGLIVYHQGGSRDINTPLENFEGSNPSGLVGWMVVDGTRSRIWGTYTQGISLR